MLVGLLPWFWNPRAFGTNIVLAALYPSYNDFVVNHNMNGMDKSPNELFAMLKISKVGKQKNPKHVMLVN